MANKFHDEAPLGEIHKAHNWEYASSAARLAASGFIAQDVGKLALQLDDMSLWILASVTPSWVRATFILYNIRGNYNASTNLFPATGGSGVGGAIIAYDAWYISVAGTLGGVAVVPGDAVWAIIDNPGQTASRWRIRGNNVTITTDGTLIRDSNDGIVGKTAGNINFKNPTRTVTNFFANATTAARTYTFPDKSITVAGIDDVVNSVSGVIYLGQSTFGATNAYLIPSSTVSNPPATGQIVSFRAHAPNSAIVPTIDIGNGMGPKNIAANNNAAGWYGDIQTGKMCLLMWNSINWELINPELVKTGSIISCAFGGSTPHGYLWCSNVITYADRVTYAALYALIGLTFGSTTGANFGIPGIAGAGTLIQAAGWGSPGQVWAGQVISHSHQLRTVAIANVGSSRRTVDAAGAVYDNTEWTGGSGNYPAGMAVSYFIKF